MDGFEAVALCRRGGFTFLHRSCAATTSVVELLGQVRDERRQPIALVRLIEDIGSCIALCVALRFACIAVMAIALGEIAAIDGFGSSVIVAGITVLTFEITDLVCDARDLHRGVFVRERCLLHAAAQRPCASV
jgi:hypothetical protein